MAFYANVFVATTLAIAQVTYASTPPHCCSTLAQALGPEYFAPNSSQYDASVMSYFTEQERLDPTCIVGPKSSQDVAKIVGMLANQSCHFAVRGGGHSLVVGAANIVDGVTIDLSAMNQVSLSADNTTASIGPGCRWRDVYDTLGPLGYAVPGGRAADVGVAGLTLGGGNSFFAAREGFVCDNVKNYEIVLGSGQIVNANNSTNSKLFTALKGGSNNFGVVTRFDIVAFAQGDIWGGVVVYPLSTAAAQIQAFVDFTNNIVNDQYSSLIGIWTYVAATAEETITNCYEYTKPQAFPPTFANLTGIQPNISSTMRISNLTDITNELESPANLRNSYNTVTFANNATIMTEVVNIVQQGLQPLKAHPDFIYWSYQFQPLPRIITDHSVAKGGNVLGLQRYPGNLILFQLDLAWNESSQDVAIATTSNGVLANITAYTKKENAYFEFEYLNYAVITANPLRHYGLENLRKLRAASKKYDPTQVFQNLVPGNFKLVAAGRA